MNIASPVTSNPLTSAVAQAVQSFASRTSSRLKAFNDDVQAGNVPAAQSFLSTLQQKVTAASGFSAGNALSGQFSQVRNDLESGNLNAAQSDFANLQSSLSHLKKSSTGAVGTSTGSASAGGSSSAGNALSAELATSGALQQAAYNSALNLSMPASVPSLSVSAW